MLYKKILFARAYLKSTAIQANAVAVAYQGHTTPQDHKIMWVAVNTL